MTAETAARMPGEVKGALAGVWFQALAELLGGWWLLTEVQSRLDHGQEVPLQDLVRFSAYVALLAGAVLLACAVCARRRSRWVRGTILGIQCAGMATSLISILTGVLAHVVALLLAFGITLALTSQSAREWFSR